MIWNIKLPSLALDTRQCRKALRRIAGADMYFTRAMLGTAELIWALTLFWPGDTFNRPTYTIMNSTAGEWTWATTFLLTGLVQWYVLLSMRFHDRFAIVFSLWNSFMWTFAVVAMYMSVYPPPAGISGEVVLAIGAWFVHVKTGAYCEPPPVGGRRHDDSPSHYEVSSVRY